MKAIFLALTLWHSNVGHTNSEGLSYSTQYIPMPTMAECQRLKPILTTELQWRVDAWVVDRELWYPEPWHTESECIER